MTYRVNSEQYVAVMAGYGGGGSLYPKDSAAYRYGNAGRIVAFKLGGAAVPIPPATPAEEPFPTPPAREGIREQIARGEVLYNRYCAGCHVFGRGRFPDLRRMSAQTHALFYDIVLGGAYQAKGMARWDDVLSRADAETIHACLVDQAWHAHAAEHAH